MKTKFRNYKSIESYLRKRTDKEFFITNTKSNILTVVIARNNSLLLYEKTIGSFSWIDESFTESILEFINQ